MSDESTTPPSPDQPSPPPETEEVRLSLHDYVVLVMLVVAGGFCFAVYIAAMVRGY